MTQELTAASEVPVQGIDSLLSYANSRRGEHGPTLIVAGRITRSVTVDGVVASRIGHANGLPVYELIPQVYAIKPNGAVEISDCHPDWFDAGNDEVELIEREDADIVIISEPGTTELHTPADADNVVQYPPEYQE